MNSTVHHDLLSAAVPIIEAENEARPLQVKKAITGSQRSVAILHYAGPPGLGGVEVTILHHARLLAAAGHQTRILAGQGARFHPDVETITDPLFGSRGSDIEAMNHELALGNTSGIFPAICEATYNALAQALRHVDVVIAHNVLTLHKNLALTTALHLLHQRGGIKKLLAWCHDFAWQDPLYLPELHPGEPWDLLRRPWDDVRYIVVSHDRQQRLAELLDIPIDQIDVVHPGVDLAAFYKLEIATQRLIEQQQLLGGDPFLLLPARITRRKNIEQAIAIAGALHTQGHQPKLVITGPPGPHNPTNATYLAELQALQYQSGAEDTVVFLYAVYTDEHDCPRPISDAMMADFYRLADALLFPSRAEGFGIPLIEAGLSGLPIFCSDIAPFREIAGAAAHYFDPYGDPARIAEQIAATLHSDLRYALRRHIRLHATWEAIYQQDIDHLIG
ncbi:MAG: glycosyltransferase [Chloroflexales bacterium]|nr:glycosyltransferase [Chloroflexales bacterium]